MGLSFMKLSRSHVLRRSSSSGVLPATGRASRATSLVAKKTSKVLGGRRRPASLAVNARHSPFRAGLDALHSQVTPA